ncbi:MAG: ABC transporter permease [Candidatus Contendobacter odensis]|uniref:ABC transporter permease n=1 Tax=Candidatus Contendibacter odensensis TaxID=1400860 RepID=A0A2G6PFA3_9GAMM|nr:MAG: ABC transporter permease [Candidatus Contendobacter odensis]
MIWQEGRLIRQSRLGQIVFYLWGSFAAATGVFVLVGLWHLAALQLGAFVLPEPLAVLRRVLVLLGQIDTSEIPLTLYRAAVAITLAGGIGIAFGILAGLSKTLSILLRPLITILLGMPPIVWMVLALFWFGMGDSSILFTILITTIPLTFAAAMRSMMIVDESLREMMQAYRLHYSTQICYLYVPHLLNFLLPALSVAAGTGIKITIMAELLGANDGIGANIQAARAMLDTVDMLAYVVVILGIVIVIEYLFIEPLRILLLPWEER